MKKFLLVFALATLLILPIQAAFTYTTTTFTQVGVTSVWYISLQNSAKNALGYKTFFSSPAKEIVIDFDYTKGDETSINFTYGFAFKTSYSTAPVAADYAYKSTEATAVAKDTRTVTGSSRWTFTIPVPDRASHFFINWANTGGTPTGTLAWDGYVGRFTGVVNIKK